MMQQCRKSSVSSGSIGVEKQVDTNVRNCASAVNRAGDHGGSRGPAVCVGCALIGPVREDRQSGKDFRREG